MYSYWRIIFDNYRMGIVKNISEENFRDEHGIYKVITMETYVNKDGSFGVIIPGRKGYREPLKIIEAASLYECATEAEAYLKARAG